MASINDIIKAFQQSGIGRDPTEEEVNYYSSFADAGKVEGDIRAQMAGGSSNGGNGSPTVTPFSFDAKAAETAAKEQLRPYYERLLKIYDGNVALAKKRIEDDYSRGLRYNSQETKNALGDNAAAKEESDRKFKLALGDLDQEMNTRGMTNSGIKATNQQNAKADQLFNQNQYDANTRDLTLAQQKFTENADVTKQNFMQENGFATTLADVPGYINNRQQKLDEFGHAMEGDVATKIANAENRAITYHNVSATPLTELTPTNYTDLLNKALITSGLPSTA